MEIIYTNKKGNIITLPEDRNCLLINGEMMGRYIRFGSDEYAANPVLIPGKKIEWSPFRNDWADISYLSSDILNNIAEWFKIRDERVAAAAGKKNLKVFKNDHSGIFAEKGSTQYQMCVDFSWGWHSDTTPHTKYDDLKGSAYDPDGVNGWKRP